MVAAFIASIVAIGIIFYPASADLILNYPIPFLLFPLLLMLLPLLIWGLALSAFQKAEEKLTPRILQLVQCDWHFKAILLAHALLISLAIFCSLVPTPLTARANWLPMTLWLITTSLAIDCIYLMTKRILDYLNPFQVVSLFSRAAHQSVDSDRELDLCNWTESLSEIAIKSLNRSSTSLCHHSIDEIREILRLFFECSKSIAHAAEDPQSRALGITDRVSYTLFYFLDRLAMIYQRAIELQVETICSAIVTTMGKIAVDAAHCDLSLVSYPVQYMGDFCLAAEKKKMPSVAIKGSCTLVEASKAILGQDDLAYQDLKIPFLTILGQLDAIAKETFRRDKESNIRMLMQPFLEMKAQFQNNNVSEHRDTASVIAAIDSILAEWETLETVLRTMPLSKREAPPLSKAAAEAPNDEATNPLPFPESASDKIE